MIYVTLEKNKISIEGHANYAEVGKDVVCASVSVLAQNFIRSLFELSETSIKKYTIRNGFIKIKHKELDESGRILFGSFLLGVEDIAHQYPQCVTIIDER